MKALLTILTIITITTNCYSQEEKAILDGKSFEINVLERGRIGKDDKSTDIITFKDGKVSTTFSKDRGFGAATYTTITKDGMIDVIISFKGKAKGKKDTIHWEGIINGDDIEGSATVKRKGTNRTIYEFKGTLK